MPTSASFEIEIVSKDTETGIIKFWKKRTVKLKLSRPILPLLHPFFRWFEL